MTHTKLLLAATALATVLTSGIAQADDTHRPRFGFGADVGVPSGAALGFVFHPWTDAVSVEASLTYNALSLGGRASLRLDPLQLAFPRAPISLFADVQGGFAGQGNVPGHSADVPSLGYDYVNLYGGLRFGRATGFNWVFEAGPTYLHATTGNFASVLGSSAPNGLVLGNPQVNGWVTPTFMTGFQVVWP